MLRLGIETAIACMLVIVAVAGSMPAQAGTQHWLFLSKHQFQFEVPPQAPETVAVPSKAPAAQAAAIAGPGQGSQGEPPAQGVEERPATGRPESAPDRTEQTAAVPHHPSDPLEANAQSQQVASALKARAVFDFVAGGVPPSPPSPPPTPAPDPPAAVAAVTETRPEEVSEDEALPETASATTDGAGDADGQAAASAPAATAEPAVPESTQADATVTVPDAGADASVESEAAIESEAAPAASPGQSRFQRAKELAQRLAARNEAANAGSPPQPQPIAPPLSKTMPSPSGADEAPVPQTPLEAAAAATEDRFERARKLAERLAERQAQRDAATAPDAIDDVDQEDAEAEAEAEAAATAAATEGKWNKEVLAVPGAGVEEPAATGKRKGGFRIPRYRFKFPLNLSGNIQSSMTKAETSGTIESEATRITNEFELQGASFIWRPWFAQISGSINLSKQDVTEGEEPTRSPSNLGGETTLQLFPRSRFPFSMALSRTNSTNDYEEFSNGIETTSAILNQTYRTLNNKHLFKGGIDYLSSDDEQFGISSRKSFLGDYQGSSLSQRYTVYATVEEVDNASQDSAERLSLVGRHSFHPKPHFGVETMANHLDVVSNTNLSTFENQTTQLSTFANWRPRNEKTPLTVNGSLRLLENQIRLESEDSDSTGADSQSMAATLFSSYGLTETLLLRGGAFVGYSRGANKAATMLHSEEVDLSFRPDGMTLGGFDYTWDVGGGVSNEADLESTFQRYSFHASHGFNRGFDLSFGAVQIGGSQGVNIIKESRLTGRQQTYNHSVFAQWSRPGVLGGTNLRLQLNDSRSVELTPSVFQLANLQFEQQINPDRDSTWSGSVTIQGTRQQPLGPGGGTFVDVLVDGNLSYHQRNLLRIPGLDLYSVIRVTTHGLTPDQFEVENDERESGRERELKFELRYRIGLIGINAELRMNDDSSNRVDSLQVQLNRALRF